MLSASGYSPECSLKSSREYSAKVGIGNRLRCFFFLREKFIQLGFVGVIVEVFVKIGARLHCWNQRTLGSVGTDRLVYLECRGVHGAISRTTIENDVDARAGKLVSGEERCPAEFGNVGEEGHANRAAKLCVDGKPGDRFGKNHVGAGRDVG